MKPLANRKSLVWSSAVALLVVCGCSGAPTGPEPPPTYDWSALSATLEGFVPSYVSGIAFAITRNAETLYAQGFGDLTPTTRVRLASATKAPSGLVILSLVDRGLLDLDEPVATYFRGRIPWPADKAAITTRMLFNHTSGIMGAPFCLSVRNTTLRDCAASIAGTPLGFPPGTAFSYGGGSMQVAGYVAEVVSGESWDTLFRQAVAEPLRLETFSYGFGENPRVAGGASASALDYLRILAMMLNEGMAPAGRVLASSSWTLSRTDQVAGVPKLDSPGGAELPGYSFGWWISSPSLHPGSPGPELSDQGAFGATPWLDLGLGYGAVLLIDDRTSTGTLIWNAVRPLITEQIRRASQGGPR
jgi:CubicO group peptidase (beta-lactamase class C family)